jgi:glycosyltransferase involved in cell wall biosynthesis
LKEDTEGLGMKILWFNWRDIKHPDAGGAEVFTHQVMQRLAKKGYDLTLFCPKFSNCLATESIDDVKIVRNGGKYTVYNEAKRYYKSYRDKYDLIIDEINTKPFLTPKFVKDKPILAIFHQLSAQFWFYETFFPLNYIGYYYLERKWLSYYRNIPTITVSNSSKEDLKLLGFKKIFLVPEGLDITPLSNLSTKQQNPTLVFIGRLTRAKLPNHALDAFQIIKRTLPNAVLWIIGDGYLYKDLEKFNEKNVVFYGRVKNELKYELLSKAHLVLLPGVREGWGLVVTESNAMGTPVIAYNIPGLRDSVINGETGILTEENSPSGLAQSAVKLLEDPQLLRDYSLKSLSYSRQFNWNRTADEFDNIIKSLL